MPLAQQAILLLEEMHTLAAGSECLLPSVRNRRRSNSKTTLDNAMRGLNLGVDHFVIHDFRRTASTHLHEAGFDSDVIEKALAHEQQGVRGIYNRAEYIEQRKILLETWANIVDVQIEQERQVILGRFQRRA